MDKVYHVFTFVRIAHQFRPGQVLCWNQALAARGVNAMKRLTFNMLAGLGILALFFVVSPTVQLAAGNVAAASIVTPSGVTDPGVI